MDTSISHFPSRIGVNFTPRELCKKIINDFNIIEDLADNKIICDPTAGTGNFILSLFEIAKKTKEIDLEAKAKKVFLIEKEPEFVKEFKKQFERENNFAFPNKNIFITDIIKNPINLCADVIIGNPPWVNFNDLPENYKETVKPYFVEAGLVNGNKVLLGHSRVDISALIILTTFKHVLNKKGRAVLICPFSLFFSEGAHERFRQQLLGTFGFVPKEIVDLTKSNYFEGIGTKHGIVHFVKADPKQVCKIKIEDIEKYLIVNQNGDPFTVQDDLKKKNIIKIKVRKDQTPRQGVNTCGANDIFFLDQRNGIVDSELVFPLIQKDQFKGKNIPSKYVLLPYCQETGKPLSKETLQSKYLKTWKYLKEHESRLSNRKGTLIQTFSRKGCFWALLGVGKYSFSKYKIVWQAYGQKTFHPILVSSADGKIWQANQSLQAFIPCESVQEGKKLLETISSIDFTSIFLSSLAQGTCNWAQPGRFKKFLEFQER